MDKEEVSGDTLDRLKADIYKVYLEAKSPLEGDYLKIVNAKGISDELKEILTLFHSDYKAEAQSMKVYMTKSLSILLDKIKDMDKTLQSDHEFIERTGNNMWTTKVLTLAGIALAFLLTVFALFITNDKAAAGATNFISNIVSSIAKAWHGDNNGGYDNDYNTPYSPQYQPDRNQEQTPNGDDIPNDVK